MITEEEWNGWLEMPQTKALRALAAARREEIKKGWENGVFRDPEQNWEAIGSCKALQILEELDYESLEGEIADVL